MTKAESTSHIYAKPMNLPAGKNLLALIQGTIESPSRMPGNTPRLFVIRKDGSGAELLRDDTIAEYFKDRLKDKNFEVMEEILPESQDAISFVTVQPLNLAPKTCKTLLYRHVIYLKLMYLADQIFSFDFRNQNKNSFIN